MRPLLRRTRRSRRAWRTPMPIPGTTGASIRGYEERIGGTNAFFIYQIYAELAGTAHVAPGLSVDASLGANLNNNLNELQPNPASALPHVRSDTGFYLKEGKNGLLDAKADYLFNIAPDWYGRVTGGILEYMYRGASRQSASRAIMTTVADLPRPAQRRERGIVGRLLDEGEAGLDDKVGIDEASRLSISVA